MTATTTEPPVRAVTSARATTVPSSSPAAPPTPSWTHRLGFDRFSALYLWAAFMIFFGITQTSTFLDWNGSIKLVLTEKAVVGILAIAFLIPLTTQTFDLSVGHMMSFSLVIVTALSKQTNIPEAVSAMIAILACALAGFVSGFVVVRLRVNSFIVTLGMSQLLAGIVLKISGNRQITEALSDGYRNVGQGSLGELLHLSLPGWLDYPLELPMYFWYLVVLAVAAWYVLEHTPLGRYLFATGGNREAARLSGVSTDRLTWGSLVASAVIAGFAGIVWSWKVGNFANTVGPGYLFPAVAAVFFGASQLRGRPNVWGSLIAVYALAFGVKGLQLTFENQTFWIEPVFEGLTLGIAVALAARHGIVRVKRRGPTGRRGTDSRAVGTTTSRLI